MLPQNLIPELREHIKKVRHIHNEDLADGWGKVQLPGDYARKSPSAAKEFKWQWSFVWAQPNGVVSPLDRL